MSKYCFQFSATDQNNEKKIQTSVENFKDEVILMALTRDQTNKIFKLTQLVIATYSDVIDAEIPSESTKLRENIKQFHHRLMGTLQSNDSEFKRNKQIEKKTTFVPPVEKAIGYKWAQKFDEKSGKIERMYVQNTFQVILPSSTIRSLFTNPDFVNMYLECVNNKPHVCEKNVYRDYCCGTNFHQTELFKNDPKAMQIMLYTDDFEPCDALKPKAGKHKKCGFYMIIRNMPKKLQSKLSNIFLVAIADSDDLKCDASIVNILEVIIEDLKVLETTGIQVANGLTIKCGLVAMSFDNLGANTCYGLVQGFQANFYCRFCERHKNECKTLTFDDLSKLRDIESYNQICARIQTENNLDATETKGIKSYCKLNDLSSFHIFKNYSVDPMHDLLEGLVPFALHALFDYCFKRKLFNLSHLQNLIQFYNYGFLNKRNIPSKLRIESRNLGQNATQLNCLISNIAFILYPYKNELTFIWPLITSLLQTLEIVSSEEIFGSDIERLSKEINRHLKFVVEKLKKELLPKHHFASHYPMVIRATGPPIYTSTIRFEAKHQELKAIVKKTNNFVNLNKTIAVKHQLAMSIRNDRYCDEFEPSKVENSFQNSEEYEKFKSSINITLNGNEMLIKSLKVNNLIFKPGLLILYESAFFEISQILHCSNDDYLFLCENSFDAQKRDLFSNSLIIEEIPHCNQVLNLRQLENKIPYQKIFVDGKLHVFCDTLKISKLIPI